jgi:hypothetical protein
MRIKCPQDFWSGIFFIVVGALGLWLGRNYATGTMMRVGPGFLPQFLCWALIMIGGVLVGRGFTMTGEPIEGSAVKPQLAIVAAILVFGVTIERVGLAPAVFVTTVLAALATPEMKWGETAILATGLVLASVGLFIYGLGQPMQIWSLL